MTYAMREYRAEKQRARIQAIVIIAGIVAIMGLIGFIATYDFCPLYYQIKCF